MQKVLEIPTNQSSCSSAPTLERMSTFPLLVHDERYSKHDLLVNTDLLKGIRVGDLLEIQLEEKHILQKVTMLVENPQLQVRSVTHR